MNDEEFRRKIASLLDALWDAHQDLVRAHQAFIQAGEALREEMRRLVDEPFRGTSPHRVLAARQAVEKARAQASACWHSLEKTLKSYRKLLSAWKTPGKRYVRFVDQAQRQASTYVRDANALVPAAERIVDAIQAIDRALRER